MHVKFNGSCLKQDKITINHIKMVNISIVYDLQSTLTNNADNCFRKLIVWCNEKKLLNLKHTILKL